MIAVMAAVGAVVLIFSRTAIIEAVYPFERAKNSFFDVVVRWTDGIFNGAAAEVENRRLRLEIEGLKMARVDLDRVESENDRLRAALEYQARESGVWMAAGVLSRNGGAASAYDMLRVDKGGDNGVEDNAVVAVPEGLVGIVESVTPSTAEIRLVADESVKVACGISFGDGESVHGILVGGNANNDSELFLKYINGDVGDIDDAIGAAVFTSGRGGRFPKGLKIGKLKSVKRDEFGDVRECIVESSVDYLALEDVFIRCEK